MSDARTNGGRLRTRAFRPALDGRLEDRVLLSHQTLHQYLATQTGLLRHPQPGVAFHVNVPPFVLNAPRFNRQFRVIHAAASQTIRGGKAVNVVAVDGTHYRIELTYFSNTVATAAGDGAGGTYTQSTPTPATTVIQPTSYPQAPGAVRVYAMPNGAIGIVVDGSTPNTELTINPLPTPIRKGTAHSYAYGMGGETHLINVGQITINSGSIGAIEGFHTANLSGPINIPSTAAVDRIAFNAILPGASITTGGTVNTLDVYQGITLNTGTSIQIGNPSVPTGDLNLLNVGGDINLSNGSQIIVGRDMGAILQPPKGTGSGSNVLSLNQPVVGTTSSTTVPSVSAYIQGNISIEPGSAFVVGRNVDQVFFVIGNITGASRIVIPGSHVTPPSATITSLGTITP
ncbi:MAG: hypothetical protein ACLP7Q_16200 [Isosphaeraceae bacterium]